jgi:hypothetical protein
MSDHQFRQETFRFPGEVASWAGECPWNGGFCFATESGRLLVPKLDAPDTIDQHDLLQNAEPINCVAFADGLVGVTTRSEVALFEREARTGTILRVGEVFDGGAFGIVTTSAGGFIAPRGPYGLLFLDAAPRTDAELRVGTACRYTLNFSKLTRLGKHGGGDVFACAARGDGLLAMTLSPSADHVSALAHNYPELDAVDVCPLGRPDWPFAVAGLGADHTVLLSRNILEGPPQALCFDDLEGTVYSILSAGGHLFILTGKSLIILPNLVARFLDDGLLERPREVWELPVEAVEAYSAYDRWILLELSDRVVSMGVNQLVPKGQADLRETPAEVTNSPNGQDRMLVRNRLDANPHPTHVPDWKRSTSLDFTLSAV